MDEREHLRLHGRVGGITSGIVYPPAIAEIASDHRLYGIGGTSAGAIAAVAAAAAELGRDSETGGFERLASLPDELKQTDGTGRTLLFRLFRPQAGTQPLFDMIWEFRSRAGWRRIAGGLRDVARMAWRSPWGVLAVAAAVIGAILLAALASPWSPLASVPLLAVVVVVVGLVRLVRRAPDLLAQNFYGLCNGTTPPRSDGHTMQNWADNDDSRAVGFRDRICTVRLGEGEGGMNLDMPPETIDGLLARGACAGDNLASIRRGERRCVADADERDPDLEANQWDCHRWIRFRLALAGMATLQRGLRSRWADVPAGSPSPRRSKRTNGPPEPRRGPWLNRLSSCASLRGAPRTDRP